MSSLSLRVVLLILLTAITGCSSVNDVKNTVSGWVNGSGPLVTIKSAAVTSGLKYGATVRVANYQDQRKVNNSRYLGQMTAQVSGISGPELLTDQDVALVATVAMKTRFDAEGFQVIEGAGPAIFEVSGVVKALTLNIKDRDDITIAIETTLKELATGKVVWSALVTEKANRFAGVSGDSKEDVMAYLNKELRIVTTKTVEAISASLMASRPELFNLTPGTHPIPGVTVLVAPPQAKTVSAAPVIAVQEPIATYHPQAGDKNGLLLVNTNPSRANVYLDGVYYGLSPLHLEIEPGIHAMSVKLTGYNMFSEKVSVRRGDNTEVNVTLAQ